MAIGYKEQSGASVPTPPVGNVYTFFDSADGNLKKKDDTGTITPIEYPSGAITAADVANVPSGDITATNVQDAINELDSEKAPITHVGSTGVGQHGIATGSDAGFMSPSDKTKIDSVEFGATANYTNAYLLNRANQTGTQTSSTISDFDSATDARITIQKGAPNGLATLDGTSKIPMSQIPSSLVGSVSYQGTWNAALNSPPLVSGVGVKGYYYIVNVAGSTNLDGITSWNIGDWAIFDGNTWGKVDNTDAVSSVNGMTGAVVITKADVGLGNADNTSDANKPISTATQNALNTKVDIVPGYGLSQENYSPTEKSKLAGIPSNANYAIDQLTGEATAGPGGGSQAITLSNAAVIAKVLTGFQVDWNIITSADSLLTAIQKLAGRAAMSLNTVSSNTVVPTGYTWIRQNRTVFSGTTKITIQSGGKITFIN